MSAGLLLPYHHRWPKVAPNAFVAAGSSVIGDVVLGRTVEHLVQLRAAWAT